MITILVRTLIIYSVLIGVIRIMGKRQIGELEVSDLVTTLLLSEIAVSPIEDHSIPLIHAIVPIVVLLSIEIIISVLITKNSALKALFGGKPSMVIKNGVLIQNELKKNRLSIDELLSELRQKSISDISDIEYAILEHNGKFSFILKSPSQQPTKDELKINSPSSGIAHPIIIDGKINKDNLSLLKKDLRWVESQAKKHKCRIDEVFLLTVDDTGKINCIKKEI